MTASIVRVGDQQRVTADTPYYEQSSSVIVLKDGGWLVTWTSFDQGIPSIHQQRYDKFGVAVEAPTRLDIGTPDPNYQSVAALADGGWVVTWASNATWDVHQQRYDLNGTAVGPETVVNTYRTYIQTTPSVTALPEPDGGWVVTWVSDGQDSSYGGIYQQRYDKNGGVVGPETQVNTTTNDSQSNPNVTTLADGGWVIAWYSDDTTDIDQQRYDKNGATVGPETTVNTGRQGTQRHPSVTALADGGWVVTWDAVGRRGIYQQRYDETGAAIGPETWISPPSFDEARTPIVTALKDGGWLVTWTFVEGAYIYAEIHQQRYGADGHPVGGAQQVNIDGPDLQTGQKVTTLPDGSWLVTWTSSSREDNSSEIYQRRFTSVAAFGEGREMGTGTAGDDLFQVRAGGLTAGDSIDGGEGDGNDTLAIIEAGILDLTAPDVFTSIETVQGSGGNEIIVADGNRLSGIAQVLGGNRTDALHLKAGSYDLSDMVFSGLEAITLLGTGSLTFDDKATALLARS
ncbi:hypothetical protein IC232_15285 [Microvirga sp. BT688]|uniref:hypothetical protein n=1 Tax=Microvirga sp. TaxID=1873136 RepID=UPI00168A345B|nr:hypothetical protein [Microvirga sp.]MBD2748058.1 hypothetical protein [Microvirga sp.]